jgi:membrane-bound lytic murein transglycosylase C
MLRVATSRSPSAALESMAHSRAESYKTNPLRLVNDIKQARANYNKLVALLTGKAGKEWGKRGVLTPSNKRYVKYTQNYKSRAIVQFDRGLVTIETLDQKQPQQSLKSAIVTTLLTPDDPRAVDLYSDKTIKLSGSPYLYGLIEDNHGRSIGTPQRAEAYADYLLKNSVTQRTQSTELGNKQVSYVKLKMVSDYENKQALRYRDQVNKYAARYGVSRSLVYAIIKTESAFNPFAVSSAPAYGLMQLVPSTAGRDAFKKVEGYDHTPSKEYLFIVDNNIKLGTAYLGILEQDYLGMIHDPLSREYCSIAAYNGGAGNVFNMFSKDRRKAADIINSLSPSEVYQRLRDKHPRDETRRYLVKVLSARREFVRI